MITLEMVQQARENAIRYGTTDKLAEYSRTKLQYEQQDPNATPPVPVEPPKLTAEHVEMARSFAKDNPTAHNITRYSTVKALYAEQEVNG